MASRLIRGPGDVEKSRDAPRLHRALLPLAFERSVTRARGKCTGLFPRGGERARARGKGKGQADLW